MLIKIKFINSLQFDGINRKACKFWLVGCLIGMFLAVYSMVNDMKKEAELLLLKSKIKPASDLSDSKAVDEAAWKPYTTEFWRAGWFEHRFELADVSYLNDQRQPSNPKARTKGRAKLHQQERAPTPLTTAAPSRSVMPTSTVVRPTSMGDIQPASRR